jgi:hypothetical protein
MIQDILAHLLIMLRNASLALFAVFTSQRHPNHARHTEIFVIKLPET